MSVIETSTPKRRFSLKTAMSVAERVGMGLIYAFVFAFVPLSADYAGRTLALRIYLPHFEERSWPEAQLLLA